MQHFLEEHSLWKVDEIFLRFYLKKNKTLSVSVKDKSCNSHEGLQLYQKEIQHIFLCIFQKF